MQQLRFQQQLSSCCYFRKSFPEKYITLTACCGNAEASGTLWAASGWIAASCRIENKSSNCECAQAVFSDHGDPLSFPISFLLHPLLACHQCQSMDSSRMEHTLPYFFPARCPKALPREMKRTARDLSQVGCSHYVAGSHASAFAKYVP